MQIKIRFHRNFKKAYKKLPVKIQKTIDARLFLFSKNPFSLTLGNHQLSGKFNNYRSINITGDYRAIYKILSKNTALFVKIGTHSELYK